MPLPAPVSTPQVNRRRPPPIDGVDASYERMVAALSGAPIAMDGSSAATATSSSSFAIPSVSVFSALVPSSSSAGGGGGVNSSSASNLLAVAASQNSSLTGSVAGGGGGTASSSAASSSPAVGGAGAGGPLGGNITAGSSSLSNNNSSSGGGGGGGVGGSGGGSSTPTPSSTSSAAAAAAAANMIGGSPSATIAPTHYLQDALTDCVEHRLQHAVHYLRQYLRHQQILVMAEAAVGSSVPGAVTSIPMPTTMGSVSVPSVVSRLTGGGASTNVNNTTNSSSSSVAPISSPSTNMSAQSAAAGGRGTSSSSSGGRSVTYFDKLHRYLFQHDGARAVRSTFALFDAAFRHEQEQKIRRQLQDEEERENESPSRQHRSSASLDTAKTYSEAVQQGEKLFNRHQWTNAQRLTHRAALFSCFTDLFYISQRMSGQTYSPASEDSTIPSRLLFTFAATTLETHLLDVATPAVVLQCLVLVLSFMSLHVDLFSTSGSTPTPAAGPHHRDTVALLTWIEQASAEKTAAMLRVLARHLEESLRCGPTTIATATTRKKRNQQQQQQAQQQQIEQQQMMMLMMTSGGGGGAGQPVESVLQSPADERAKELLLSRIASACGLNSAVGSSSSNSTSGPSSSSSGVSSPFAPTRAATSNASPTTNPSSDVTGGANRQKRSFTLLDFDLVLEVVRLLIQMHTRVAIPMYSMLLSRCKPSFLSPPSVPPPQNSSTDKHVGAVTDSAASSSSTLGNLVLSLDDVQDTLKALSVIPGGVHAQLAEASRATTLMDEVVEHMHRVRRVLVQESVTGSGSMNHHQVGPTTAAASKPQQHGSSSSSSSSAKSSKHHHNHHHSNADGSDNGGGSATSGAASTVEDVFRRGTFLDRLPYTAASSSSTSALKQQGGAGGGDHCVTLSYVSGRVLLGVMRALIPPTSPSGA